jgi:hypothetical protein
MTPPSVAGCGRNGARARPEFERIALRHREVLQRPQSPDGVFIFALKDQGCEQEKLKK